MSLIVIKKIKDVFKSKGIKVSQSTLDSLNKELEKLCLKTADNVVADKLKVAKSNHVPSLDMLLDSSSELS
ncbi:MAG: hypothetical protein OXC37_02000 [Bdellovibrionaceae bacterium]|nr:hypothetical protein [Pseudobdellovibrionaceae bacterium]